MIIYIGFILFGILSLVYPQFWTKNETPKPGKTIEQMHKEYRIMGAVFIAIGIFFIIFTN